MKYVSVSPMIYHTSGRGKRGASTFTVVFTLWSALPRVYPALLLMAPSCLISAVLIMNAPPLLPPPCHTRLCRVWASKLLSNDDAILIVERYKAD